MLLVLIACHDLCSQRHDGDLILLCCFGIGAVLLLPDLPPTLCVLLACVAIGSAGSAARQTCLVRT